MDHEFSGARPKTTSDSILLEESGKTSGIQSSPTAGDTDSDKAKSGKTSSAPSSTIPDAASSDEAKPKATPQAPNYGSFKKPEDKPLALPKGQRESNPLLRKALANRTKQLSTGAEPQPTQRKEGDTNEGTERGNQQRGKERGAAGTRSKTDSPNQPTTATDEHTADPEDRSLSPGNDDPEPRLDIEDRLFDKLLLVGVIYYYHLAPVIYIVMGEWELNKVIEFKRHLVVSYRL